MGHIVRKSMDVGTALFAFGICGIAGVLVDADHLIKVLFIPEASWRILHIPILIACGIALCGCGAYCGGLYIRAILKSRRQ